MKYCFICEWSTFPLKVYINKSLHVHLIDTSIDLHSHWDQLSYTMSLLIYTNIFILSSTSACMANFTCTYSKTGEVKGKCKCYTGKTFITKYFDTMTCYKSHLHDYM